MSSTEVLSKIGSCSKSALIAIDGLPCSGKSTVAEQLKKQMDFSIIELDEFVLPEQQWPSRNKPAFPFEYIRYTEFLHAVETLATHGECVFYPFDWETFSVSTKKKTVRLTKPVIIEGISALNTQLCPLYEVKIFVKSDRVSCLQAAIDRGMGKWAAEWRDLFLPSADIYMQTKPWERANLVIDGRGILCD